MGESFVVSIEEIRRNDYCLHPMHYKGLCPGHHKDAVMKAKNQEKIKRMKKEIERLKKEICLLEGR